MRIRNPKKSRVLGVVGVRKSLKATSTVACSHSNTNAEIPYTKAKKHQWCSENQPTERTPALSLPAGRSALSAATRTPAKRGAVLLRGPWGAGRA